MFNNNNIISNCPICEEKALHVINSMVDGTKASSQQCINCGYATTENFDLNGKPKEENSSYKALTDQMKEWVKEVRALDSTILQKNSLSTDDTN